ncbi:Hypothetical protein, putative [Bodo saltans]|uniref:Endonuclease/exonuclease/phosphatase domain-containing protein n=1 Tax=Bodo saltans TaxID=75058 RepID=A0A0S4JIK0_BODSA|nr:Hypothetical protein, putative [Bodo saltans]|eukprot:CUG91342.1 Hypothetical protein, putative [Bodo saltans]
MRRTTILLMKDGIRGESVFNIKTNMKPIGSNYMFEKSAPEDAQALTAFFDRAELLLKQRHEKFAPEDEGTYVPPLKRSWVKAPPSVLSTSVSRRDWFRFMSFNWMADSFTTFDDQAALKAVPKNSADVAPTTPVIEDSSTSSSTAQKEKDTRTTTPVIDLEVRIPAFARPGASESKDGSGYVTYDPTIDVSLPPFLDPNYRRSYLVNEVRHYDPDLLCLNEINRSHFNESIWKYLRSLGYGVLYTSSRGFRVKALRKGDLASSPKHLAKVPEQEDIGNVLCFHKARFVPNLMPGAELPNHLHFVQFCSLKDKVTNMVVLLANVQLTIGDTIEAQSIREHEAKMVLKILQSITQNDADRSHTTVIVCGDLNCTDDEEGCVLAMREKLFSAYDLVGGPRWTTWCKSKNGGAPNAYYETNRGFHQASNQSISRDAQMQVAIQRRVEDRGFGRTDAAVAAAAEKVARSLSSSTTASDSVPVVPRKRKIEKRFTNPKFPWLSEVRVVDADDVAATPTAKASTPSSAEESVPPTPAASEVSAAPSSSSSAAVEHSSSSASPSVDMVEQERRIQLHQGIIKRTQDFIFYDPNTLALHKVLDVPDDMEIDDVQMLPSTKHPSHHIPLIIDVSFNDILPDVGMMTSKP